MKELAERARRVGDEYYPKVVDLLAEDGKGIPRHFDIVFKERLKAPNARKYAVTAAYTKPWRTTIYLSTAVWEKPTNYLGSSADPVTFNAALIHEMAHMTRRYPLKAELLYDMAHIVERHPRRLEDYWEEGVADYACFKLGFTNDFFCPKCSASSPDYYAGYQCAGAFLLYLDSIYGPELIRQLRTQLSRRSYSDTFFSRYTGQSLASLWSDFQKTPAFTPVAARIDELRQSLGYVDGQPPQDFANRFEAYVRRQPFGREVTECLRAAERVGEPIRDPRILTQMYTYFSEPGGSAFSLLQRLYEHYKLPGVSKTDYGSWDSSFLSESPEAYPAVQTLHFRKLGTTVICNYTVRRESQGAPWKLQRAWGTDDRGKLIQEYPLVESELEKDQGQTPY